MATLERAIEIAASAHAGQTDKAGQPYILHPLRVMLAVSGGEAERIVAVLHDVLEDCPEWGAVSLAEAGFSETVVEAVESVTRRAGEEYMDYVLRAEANPIGRMVKIADLQDNLGPARILASAPGSVNVGRYQLALKMLLSGPTHSA